eukprot:m.460042 g.460042  ORF g.460042 m.460042 type:complete len:72 (+) comp21911_c0_seq1:1640-1855(+)
MPSFQLKSSVQFKTTGQGAVGLSTTPTIHCGGKVLRADATPLTPSIESLTIALRRADPKLVNAFFLTLPQH